VFRFRVIVLFIIGNALLAACAHLPPAGPKAWTARLAELQSAGVWRCAGRAAASVGNEGWQANLRWEQHSDESKLSLSGPLGVGAIAARYANGRLQIEGAQITEPAADFLRERLGFSPPIAELRYWLLGVPAPDRPAQLEKNSADRLQRLSQSGWVIDYIRYRPVANDVLPDRMTLTQGEARARIVVEHWEFAP
jgi:outer membrane lipoprotein LolB